MLQFDFNGLEFKFMDSFKLMPMGLDKLMKDFHIQVGDFSGKLPFNHEWMNASNLHYEGAIPDWLEDHYPTLIQLGMQVHPFSIQSYCEHYNRIDCEGLHKLISKFFHQFSIDLKLDLTHCVTLPQLCMELFRSHWLDSDNTIRLLSDQHYNFIKKAYKGANVSVYKPYGEHLYAYDINSLYPYVMKKPMPVGTPKPYDISKGLGGLFGFAEAVVICPSELKIPVLPMKAKINGSEKLIFPTGEFRGVFFSEELKYAESLGYKITLVKAISFKPHYTLFHGFVDFFFERKATAKGAARGIAKLCLNSLYGRFPMQKDFDFNIITRDEVVQKVVEDNFIKIAPVPLSNKSVLYSFSLAPNPNKKDAEPENYELLEQHYKALCDSRVGNIGIAAAITAYARCETDRYKRLPGITCYYSDTDCVHVSAPLPKYMIGDGLGMMKNELADANYTIDKDADYYYNKGLFLRDKVYCLVLRNGREITKFSGLNRKLVPEKCFDMLFDVLKNGGNITLLSSWMRRCISSLTVSAMSSNKTFNFDYNKRLIVRGLDGTWIDTKPIEVTLKKQTGDPNFLRRHPIKTRTMYSL